MDSAEKFLVYVDPNDTSHVGVRFARLKAQKNNCDLILPTTIENVYQQAFASVADALREETKNNAEQVLSKGARLAQEFTGMVPELKLDEGNPADKLSKIIEQDSKIVCLVVVSFNNNGNNTIISIINKINTIPLIILPITITDQQINLLI